MSMSINSLLCRAWKRLFTAAGHAVPSSRRPRRRAGLGVEALEDRAVPASVFSVDQFEDNIRSFFVDNSVGFAYSIAQDGAIVRSDGWGDARTDADGQVDFTEDTKMTSASVAKTITATAILKILQHDKNISVDSFIWPYLPSAWIQGQGPNINTITFRELLTHHSGLRRIDFDANGSDGTEVDYNGDGFGDYGGAGLDEQTWYSGLQQLINLGIIPADEDQDGFIDPLDADGDGQIDRKVDFEYENANFALMRVMTAYLLGDGAAADAADDPAQYTADVYVAYVRDNVLAPMGIENADTKTTEDTPTLCYPYPAGDANGFPWGDRTLYAGGEGWWLSANDYVKFLIGLRTNDDVLFPEVRELMRDGFLGLNNPVDWGFAGGMFGTYYGHGGDLNNLHTYIVDFPNNVQVSLLVNCDFGGNVPHGLAYQGELLKRAFENAWPELEINGTSGPDEFLVRRSGSDPNAINVFLNGDFVVRRWVESLDSLTLNGLDGDDTFIVGSPDAQPGFIHIQGALTILGGAGLNTLIVDDAAGIGEAYSIRGIDNAEIPLDGIIDGPNGIPGNLFLYDGIEHLVLYANNDPNQIEVEGITAGMTVDVYTGFNDDTVLVSDLASDVTINVHGGADNDTIRVWNVAADTTVNVFGDVLNLPGGNDTLILGMGNLGTVQGTVFFEGAGSTDLLVLDDSDAPAPAGRGYQFTLGSVTASGGFGGLTYSTRVEKVLLHASNHVDTVNVETLGAETDLELYGHDGTDVFLIAGLSQNVDSVLGDVVIHGGDGYRPSFLPNMAFPEDDDQLYVRDDENAVAGNFTLNLHQGNVLVGRLNKLGGNPSAPPPNVIYDQIERTELHTDAGANTISVVAAPRFNQVSVYAGGGADQIDVESTPLFAAAMQIFGEGGEDTIRVSPTAQNLGSLHSLLSVDGGSGLPAERDNLIVNDTFSGNVAPYELDSSSLTRAGSAGIDYATIEDLLVSLSGADNEMTISSTAPGTTVVILGRAGNDTLTAGNLASSVTFVGGAGLDDRAVLVGTNGNDTITVTGDTMTLGAGSLTCLAEHREVDGRGGMDTFNVGNGTVDSIGGGLVLRGGGDSDAVIVNDQDDLGNDTYTVTFNQVSKPSFLLLYDDMETLTLNAGADNNTININSTAAATPVLVNAGAGGDTIHLSPSAQNLSFINGPVTVNGQQGVDTVFLHEELFVLGGLFPYTITHSTVSRSFFGGLSFDTIERLRLNLGTGNNTVNVTEFNRDVLFALYGNVGADTFNVTVSPSLQDTGGRLFIDGGGNGDRLNVAYATKPEVPEKPKVHHKKSPPEDAGTITVEYPEALYDIVYQGMEEVEIDKL